MRVELSDEARRLVALFEDEAAVTVRDCVVDEDHDQVVYLVKRGEMADAIGPGGQTVERVEERLGREVKLVEAAETAEDFVANALAPAAVYNVTVSENDDTVAYVEVAQEDRGAAIGREGRNIDAARQLAKRHFEIDGIELT
ncbi:transcription elongation factor NusA [Haloarcula hispanica N601]|jgi:N utilization substance protein A|uniref:Probable transcription termination protein NusA n=7 Tax=Haloarcula TaxID=2237 RepID=A0A482T854_HALHI|nr:MULTISPECIES: NusA-like transcription termination signal-binding factor [Haloarcula]AEM58437.1 putative transcription elongation factor NusA protein [Haloarcula hispanica ATCC 33960]AHB67160.1 transcription elongation factor NusA [Haloarcula hispanica N601]AJF25432.1 transcription elongation factor NusA [Haloarcula sp. CBA1115]EMA11005.1 transcription elongation factor NusA-like protein [Haloarcula vallismortis ATCC 29715]KAA9405924.1 NusA-like transcription termination signal-binding facto